jgi:hypothetical protein
MLRYIQQLFTICGITTVLDTITDAPSTTQQLRYLLEDRLYTEAVP